MRVGMLAHLLSFGDDYRQAGVSRYIEYLLRDLPEALEPCDDLLILAGKQARNPNRIGQLPASLQWNWSRWPTRKVPVRVLWEQLAGPVVARRKHLDLIHGPVNVVPLASRTPTVVTIHDLAFMVYPEQYPSLQRRYLRTMTMASVKKAERVIAVSEYTGRDVAERLSIPVEKVAVIPNGVSEIFYPRRGTPELERFRDENHLPDEFLLFVGTLQPRKNLPGLLRAYATLHSDDHLPLYVVGAEGWMYREIFDQVARLGISDDVRFAGYAASDTLPLWYSAATAFIYPSFYEGFGLPVLEAMACGTPVVASNRSSLPEVVGDSGLLVNPEDPEEIAEAIRALLADSGHRANLGSQGEARARQFTWQRTAAKTATVYREVANGP